MPEPLIPVTGAWDWPADWTDDDIHARSGGDTVRASMLVHMRFACQQYRAVDAQLAERDAEIARLRRAVRIVDRWLGGFNDGTWDFETPFRAALKKHDK